MSQDEEQDKFGENSVDPQLVTADQVLIDHSENPRCQDNIVSSKAVCSEQKNPLCGDHLRLCIETEADRVVSIQAVVKGCAVSTASASLISEFVLGRTVSEVFEILEQVEGMLAGKPYELQGEIAVLDSLGRFPLRHRCVLLGVEALRELLD